MAPRQTMRLRWKPGVGRCRVVGIGTRRLAVAHAAGPDPVAGSI